MTKEVEQILEMLYKRYEHNQECKRLWKKKVLEEETNNSLAQLQLTQFINYSNEDLEIIKEIENEHRQDS